MKTNPQPTEKLHCVFNSYKKAHSAAEQLVIQLSDFTDFQGRYVIAAVQTSAGLQFSPVFFNCGIFTTVIASRKFTVLS